MNSSLDANFTMAAFNHQVADKVTFHVKYVPQVVKLSVSFLGPFHIKKKSEVMKLQFTKKEAANIQDIKNITLSEEVVAH